ncbi:MULTISPECIES: GCG_CRPN prefix-to-repeats domain-containing protein [Legionella]|uniref:Uncharacterized protein n=1 Tax=Legionella quinlivanii TaxID=45073 RepID=A0A364LLM7_9GAMM|nr:MULTISPECIES: hypothetical protein [Legionella]MCE3045538.1 hypothetical protein [Legionella sp. 16cNR16C]MCW8452062.1 hypothetical protein [Legionella quinlivanii]RAP37622.1 hypothetical protein B1207_05480 [Legionella quinlivanii]
MKIQSLSISKVLTPLALGALLTLGIGYTSSANAAQGCGFGNHMNYWGRCVPNEPGPWAKPVPGRPDCWVNDHGAFRCYR